MILNIKKSPLSAALIEKTVDGVTYWKDLNGKLLSDAEAHSLSNYYNNVFFIVPASKHLKSLKQLNHEFNG